MKIVIIYSKFFQNKHQNASIIKCLQKFLHENYPSASMYLKYLFIIKMIFKKNIYKKTTKNGIVNFF